MIRYLKYYGFGVFAPQAWRYFSWLYNNCRRTYVPSADTKRFLEDRGIHDVEVFDRGVDIHLYHPRKRNNAIRASFGVEPDGILILYVGRMSKEKSLDLLLNQFLHLYTDYPSIRLVLTGEGPLQRKLMRRFDHANITFTGAKRGEDLAGIYASADIFAIPSSTETLSLVSMEAMASGLPVLGMNAGGICDVVRNRETGMLAASPDEFERLLRLLIENKEYRITLAAGARKAAESRSWLSALSCLEQSYQALMPTTQAQTS
jgi:glycosyltransferase involved in cell wall biosynthesis